MVVDCNPVVLPLRPRYNDLGALTALSHTSGQRNGGNDDAKVPLLILDSFSKESIFPETHVSRQMPPEPEYGLSDIEIFRLNLLSRQRIARKNKKLNAL